MTQIAKRQEQALATMGSFADAHSATAALQRAQETMNLVSPASSVGQIPEGFEIVLSHVLVDLSTRVQGERTVYTSGDVYPTDGGKFGLSKNVLHKIAASIGVTWVESYRVDDGSHPFYCHWRAVCEYRAFDGQVQREIGNKQMDLREGSKQVQGKTPKQVDQERKFIMEHAESKAKLRAIRDLGIKTGYTLEELQKPFVAARLMLTGHSTDPATRRMLAGKIADNFLSSRSALYASGGERRAAPPPPVDAAHPDSGEYSTDSSTGEVYRGGAPNTAYNAAPERARDAAPAQQQQQQEQQRQETKPSAQSAVDNPDRDMVLKFSRSKGKKIREAATDDLEWIRKTVSENLESDNSPYPENDAKLLAAVKAELAARGGY